MEISLTREEEDTGHHPNLIVNRVIGQTKPRSLGLIGPFILITTLPDASHPPLALL
jgi:hypothetical protein